MQTNLKMVDENFNKERKPKIICSKLEWELMDKEEAYKKECVERTRLAKPLGNNNKYVWLVLVIGRQKNIK